MYITHIEVSQLRGIPAAGRTSGFVSLHSEERQVQVHYAVAGIAGRAPREALITEALRQLRKMPEYRSGRRELSFAPGILAERPTIA
ncbi:MAG: hypothetical protein R3256_03655 [Thalassovita sp.]|nr:hypothetical protein [Thalassovita sp.]